MLALVMIEISTCLSAFEYKQRLASVKHMLVDGALDGDLRKQVLPPVDHPAACQAGQHLAVGGEKCN
jgi:hypothetical protein